ncbi:hypothetical protein IID62_09800, partial [candidate division KSB1 bacterium]|nr:hypothetical protein [candidate division KSB1 bacterium]
GNPEVLKAFLDGAEDALRIFRQNVEEVLSTIKTMDPTLALNVDVSAENLSALLNTLDDLIGFRRAVI